jgi:hypothetical protein
MLVLVAVPKAPASFELKGGMTIGAAVAEAERPIRPANAEAAWLDGAGKAMPAVDCDRSICALSAASCAASS